MTDDSSAPHPGPPFPVDLVADLHAGALPEDEAAALWPRVRADPAARRVLDALDATRADLASAPVADEPPPAAVRAAIEATLASLEGARRPRRATPQPMVRSSRSPMLGHGCAMPAGVAVCSSRWPRLP